MTATFDKKTNQLTIVLDANKKPEPSVSGKTMVLASTHGNKTLEVAGFGTLTIGVNAYYKP